MRYSHKRGFIVRSISELKSPATKWLFLIGLGSQTQINVGGYTAISELFLVLLLPWMFFKNFKIFSKDRCSAIIFLLIIWMLGVCVTDIWVHNYFAFFIRGFIAPLGILASVITIYPLLKQNPSALKWFLLGTAISSVVCVFIFQPGTTLGSAAVQSGAMSAAEARMSYKLFWVGQMNAWLGLPVSGWYMQFPILCSVMIGTFIAVFSLITGGRSAFAIAFLSTVLITICGHSRERMRDFKRHGFLILVGFLVLMPIIKLVYKEAATRGWMGDEEKSKYYAQAEGGSAIDTLMRGRGEVFIAFNAIKDKPIMGHGSYALDTKGYRVDFFMKHGNDYETVRRIQRIEMLYGVRTIPAHSHIACFWMWAGIPGLLPWLYILYLLYLTLFKRVYVYPPYFGYFALVIPSMLWAIFFSPFGSRIGMGFLIAACLVVQTMEREQKKMMRIRI